MKLGSGLRRWVIAGVIALGVATSARAAPDWKSLDWLIGAWTATGGGADQGVGGFSFVRDAGGQVLVRRNFADYPAQNGRPASRHEDLMVISREPAGLRAAYWDSEGHVIHYDVATPADGAVSFLSTDAAGPRFRLSYRRTPRGLDGAFEVAPPDQPARFAPYLSWSARRVK